MVDSIGQAVDARITPKALTAMREEIQACGGREVFFAGTLNANGLIDKVRVCARGSATAVPAFFETLAHRDIVIHNHPSGDIAPSSADLDVAGICAHNGHGVYIVDNAVERVYIVVEPFLDKDRHRLDPEDLAAMFKPNSRMARILPQFEIRPQQAAMMDLVANAFNEDGISVIESPTGVGKTFAYLVPALRWALENRERVVVSTRTINLQEQIVFKDIPLLQKCIEQPFTAVLVKGRSNYLCRRKLTRALSEMMLFDDERTQDALAGIEEWAKKTEDGSRSDLTFVPPRDVWERVCSEVDTCTGGRCPSAKECFVTKARREIAKADLIIANHHILFSDISVKRETGDFSSLAVLPAYKRVIFDEAHSIEDSATEYFGIQATRAGTVMLLGRFLRRERHQDRGLIPYIKLKLIKQGTLSREETDQILDLIDNTILPALAMIRESSLNAFDAIRNLAAQQCKQIGRDIKWRLTEKELADPDLRRVHSDYVIPAVEEIQQCEKACGLLESALKRVKPAPDEVEAPFVSEIMELRGYRLRLHQLAQVLSEGTCSQLLANTVRWIEIDSSATATVRIVRCPLDVGACMAEDVYANLKTIVMTSATLSVQQKFRYYFSRVGLDRVPESRIQTAILGTPFKFDEQALLCISSDTVPPDDKEFMNDTVECLRRILGITRGHALVLFTSFYALDHAHKSLQEELRKAGIIPLKQGEATRTQLLERFRRDISSVLFATDSFWEGIDVAGDALQCVVLPRLPFRVPTEPIQQARAEAVDGNGGNSFMEYTVPQAVIKFRQGFGRLIRRRSDRGTVVVLDQRITTKRYGKVFLDSLPGIKVVTGPCVDIYRTLEDFYKRQENRP